MKPLLLDLFCGAGGASMGYADIGFDVVGVDFRAQRHYPFEFFQADAIDFLAEHGHEFDAIHASPPCQEFSIMRRGRWQDRKHPNLLVPLYPMLGKLDVPWVVENVEGARPYMKHPILLCGTMFGLGTKHGSQLRRHRLFDANFHVPQPTCQHRTDASVIGVYGGGQHPDRRRVPVTIGVYGNAGGSSKRDGLSFFSSQDRRDAMGIDWMRGKELSEAIPPMYTSYIGWHMMDQVFGWD